MPSSPEPTSDVSATAHLAKAFRAFHQIEKAYAIVMFAIFARQVWQVDSGLNQFLALWSGLAFISLLATLWPSTPFAACLLAEVFLTSLVIGHWIAQSTDILPALSRFSICSDTVPLADRRFLAWNMLAGLVIAWALIPYGFFLVNRQPILSWAGFWSGLATLIVSALMLVLFIAMGMYLINL